MSQWDEFSAKLVDFMNNYTDMKDLIFWNRLKAPTKAAVAHLFQLKGKIFIYIHSINSIIKNLIKLIYYHSHLYLYMYIDQDPMRIKVECTREKAEIYILLTGSASMVCICICLEVRKCYIYDCMKI